MLDEPVDTSHPIGALNHRKGRDCLIDPSRLPVAGFAFSTSICHNWVLHDRMADQSIRQTPIHYL